MRGHPTPGPNLLHEGEEQVPCIRTAGQQNQGRTSKRTPTRLVSGVETRRLRA